jgi:hypothetical protein
VAQCTANKRNGERCTLPVVGKQGVCWAHDPDNAEQRRRRASRGGRGKAGREIRDLKKQLEDLASDVLEGRVERGDAIVVNQILNTRARLIDLERKVRETEEIEERLEALEQKALEQTQESKGATRWGA